MQQQKADKKTKGWVAGQSGAKSIGFRHIAGAESIAFGHIAGTNSTSRGLKGIDSYVGVRLPSSPETYTPMSVPDIV
eukprot:314598-Rhodomonas_salina.1